jgi:hypothetical protein
VEAQVLAVATLEGTYSQRVNNSSWQAIALATGRTTLPFETTKSKERIVITYSASCLAGGFIIYVRANVDGAIASPGTTSGVSLCSIPAVGGSTYPASRTFSAVVAKKGVHNLTLEVRGNGAAILIGDSALVVQR